MLQILADCNRAQHPLNNTILVKTVSYQFRKSFVLKVLLDIRDNDATQLIFASN